MSIVWHSWTLHRVEPNKFYYEPELELSHLSPHGELQQSSLYSIELCCQCQLTAVLIANNAKRLHTSQVKTSAEMLLKYSSLISNHTLGNINTN